MSVLFSNFISRFSQGMVRVMSRRNCYYSKSSANNSMEFSNVKVYVKLVKGTVANKSANVFILNTEYSICSYYWLRSESLF